MQRSTQAPGSNTHGVAREKILVVDENLANLRMLGFVLIAHGYDLRYAMSADEALTAIDKEVPDLVLIDLQLPNVDPLGLIRQLKAAPATEDVIIVGLTGDALRKDDERALAAGCVGALTKPIDTRTLADRIAAFLVKPVAKP